MTIFTRIRRAVVGAVLAVLSALGVYTAVQGQSPTYAVTWEHPTQYTSGATLAVADIAATNIEWRLNNGTPQTKQVAAPVTSTTIPKVAGTTCAKASTTLKSGETGGASAEVCVTWNGAPGSPVNLKVQ